VGVDYSPWRRREESGGSIGVDEGGNERTNEGVISWACLGWWLAGLVLVSYGTARAVDGVE